MARKKGTRVDNKLADELIGVLSSRPDLHSQRLWMSGFITPRNFRKQLDYPDECGTTACLAGWVAALTCDAAFRLSPNFIILDDGNVKSYSYYARERLGLTHTQAAVLFRVCETTEEVIHGLKYLKDHPDADGVDLTTELWPLPADGLFTP
jgi:hypothetical protein